MPHPSDASASATSAPRALILAAGVGERLAEGSDAPPKALLRFGGRTLLERHFDILRRGGVPGATVVTGHRAEMVEAEIARLGADAFFDTVFNPDYRQGSVVSLWTARDVLRGGGPVLLMDADVLYDRRLMARLLGSRAANCFLFDRAFEPGEEPVKLCLRQGRIVDFRKAADTACDEMGESVGFFRFTPGVARRLADITDAYVRQGRTGDPYEEAIRDLVLEGPGAAFGVEDVTGLPWIEIDFPQDVRRAREDVLPRLEDRGG